MKIFEPENTRLIPQVAIVQDDIWLYGYDVVLAFTEQYSEDFSSIFLGVS